MKTKVVTFKPLKGFKWKVKLYFHPTWASARDHYRELFDDEKLDFKAVVETCDKGRILAKALFYRKAFTVPILAHEAAHIGLHFATRSGLDLKKIRCEELYAEMIESVVKKALDNLPRGW